MNKPSRVSVPEKDPDREPLVLAAAGMLEQEYVVVREPDETDLEYEARVQLFNLLLDRAKRG